MVIQVAENLSIRTLTKENVKAVFTTIEENRAYLRVWLPWVDHTTQEDQVAEVIQGWAESFEKKTNIAAGIFLHDQYIGNIGLHGIDQHNKSGEIGYWLAEKHQGSGIMTACVSAFIHYCMSELGLNRVVIRCAVGNAKSNAIPKRLGFTLEGINREAENLNGTYVDLMLYSMLKKDWKAIEK